MANTSQLTREKRKEAKRASRLKLKSMYGSMTPVERDKYKQEKESKPTLGVKAFLATARKK